MKLFSRDPVITFSCAPELKGAIPDPIPASQATPKWFRKMSLSMDNSLGSTVKRCVPFKDAMDMGYIIPLWVDINVVNDGQVVSFSYHKEVINPMFSDHNPRQIPNCPISKTTYGNQPMKFTNPWVIKTRPGWSCLFIQPINHFDNKLQIITGVVDTDKYLSKIHFPFVWMDREFNGLIPQGTPLVQVIPFKRTECTHDVVAISDEDMKKDSNIQTKIGTSFKNVYRLNWWEQKRYR